MIKKLDKLEYPYPSFDGTQNCFGLDTDWFYPEKDGNPHLSKRIADQEKLFKEMCNACDFLDSCRTYAIHHERDGFWGGMSAKERKEYRKKNNIICYTPDLLFKNWKGDYV